MKMRHDILKGKIKWYEKDIYSLSNRFIRTEKFYLTKNQYNDWKTRLSGLDPYEYLQYLAAKKHNHALEKRLRIKRKKFLKKYRYYKASKITMMIAEIRDRERISVKYFLDKIHE